MNPWRARILIVMLGGWIAVFSLLLCLIWVRVAWAGEERGLDPALSAAIALYRADGAAAALPEFERLLTGYRALGERPAEAQAQRYVGECLWRLGELERSEVQLTSAIDLARKLQDRILEARAKNVRGLLRWDQGAYQEAIADFEQAHGIALELSDRRLAASTLNNRGLVYDELGDFSASLADYELALELFTEEGDRRGQGDALGNIGGVHLLLGRFEKALEGYRQALSISEELGSKPAMSIDHGNIALALLGMGRIYEALTHFDLALALARDSGMVQEAAFWLRGRGNALILRGDYDLGLESHREAVRAYEASGARGLLVDAQQDMGTLLLKLGDHVAAGTWFQQAVQSARQIGQEQALTRGLVALGDLQLRLQNLEEARTFYLQASERSTESGDLAGEARALLRQAHVDLQIDRLDSADVASAQALRLAQETGALPIQAEAWLMRGELARAKDELQAGLLALERAGQAAGPAGDPDLMWRVQHSRGRVLERAGRGEEALTALEAAVAIIEGVRERLREERFRSGWVEDKYQVYIDLVRLQLQLGRAHEAFSTAERLRARSFLSQLDRSPVTAADERERGEEIALRERIRQLQNTLSAEQQQTNPNRRESAIHTFSTELLQAERAYQALLDDWDQVWVRKRVAQVLEIGQIQRRLAPHEALLEYVAGPNSLVFFLVRQGDMQAFTSDSGDAELTSRVNLLRELILRPNDQSWRVPASGLSELLLQPLLRSEALSDVSHLYIVPYGSLNHLPFALLPLSGPDGRVFVEQFTLSYLPAAAALAVPDTPASSDRSLLALAPAAARLRFAPREAASVASLFEPDARLLLGAAATETAFKSEAGAYRVLHFATHGVFNPRNPLLSGLELEPDLHNDGVLEVHEILNLALEADLVTMSACQTGMSSGWFSDLPAGDEFVGLTRAFLIAGSRSVLASLWEVDDRSTVKLMQGFYGELDNGPGTPDRAVALARVQRQMHRSRDYNHPFYWAPFVLVGQHGQMARSSSMRSLP